jgi:uncharacterized protein (TIGR02466 family)
MKNLLPELQKIMTAFQAGNLSLAEASCQQILMQYPEQADALHLLALVSKKNNQYQKAEQFFIRSLKSNINNASVHLNFANFLTLNDRKLEAKKSYQSAISLAPNNIDALYNYSLLLNQLSDYKQAINIINKAIHLNDKLAAFYNVLASAYKNLKQFNQAIIHFKTALTLQPNDFFAWHNLGVTYRSFSEPKKAIECYKNILIVGEKIPELHFNIGCAYYDIGELKKAELSLKTAIKLRPDYVMAHETINNLFWENSLQNKFLASYHLYLKDANQPSEDMYFSFIAQLILSKNTEQAIDSVQQAITRFGPKAKFCHALATLYLKNGIKHDKSTALIAEAIKQDPNNSRFRIDIANIFIQQENYLEALQHLDIALQTSPLNQEIWAFKGICWRLLNDEREQWLNNYQELVGIQKIIAPKQYDNLEHFMFELKDFLTNLHNTTRQPLDQSIIQGSQTTGNLLLNKSPIIQQLKAAVNTAATNYIKALPKDNTHPFLSRIQPSFDISGCWSVLLKKQGYHTNHVHPDGWLSGPTYISVPDDISPNDPQKSGWIKFGETSLKLDSREHVGLEHCPEEGDCVFFPSYMWHGTHPTKSNSIRMTTSCDIKPFIK